MNQDADRIDIRPIEPGQEEALEAFLVEHLQSSMFLLSNLKRAGLKNQGKPYEGAYLGAWKGESLCGVSALYWNGMLILQSMGHTAALVEGHQARDMGAPSGLVGPWAQVEAAREALGAQQWPCRMNSREYLYDLPLDALEVPPALASGQVRCRRATLEDLEVLIPWRLAQKEEMEGGVRSEEDKAGLIAGVYRAQSEGVQWVLERQGELVSMSTFNAHLPQCVQIGGVYTPPALRGNGHARAVVAGSLLVARSNGTGRSILFTGEHNEPAQRAYLALGYRRVGQYGIVLFG